MMDSDAGLQLLFKVKAWQGIKPKACKYETFGGWYVIQARWAWFTVQVDYR